MPIPYHLQQIAALGTKHALAPKLDLPEQYQKLAVNQVLQEAQLLLSIAGISFAQQAGYIAPKDTFEFRNYPARCGRLVTWLGVEYLKATIRYFIRTRTFTYRYRRPPTVEFSNPLFFYEWCAEFLASGKVLPGELIPRLLTTGIHYEELRAGIYLIVGEKGEFLASQRPDKWHWLLDMEPPTLEDIYPRNAQHDELMLSIIHDKAFSWRLDTVAELLVSYPYRCSSQVGMSIVHFLTCTHGDMIIAPAQFQMIARNFVLYAPVLCQNQFIDLVSQGVHSKKFCENLREVVHFRQQIQRSIAA